MVENNDLKSENTMNSVNVKLITDKKKLLEETTLNIREEIKSGFEHLICALKSREKQLLRQVEAVYVQQLSLIQSNSEIVSSKPLLNVDLSSIYDLESQISRVGKLEVFGKNGITVKDTEPYKVQEYQDADKDHESFNKSIKFEPIECEGTSDANVPICDDRILNCSCNSSLDSSLESEGRSNQEISVLSISDSTVMKNELFVADSKTLANCETESDSLSSTNEDLKIDSLKDGESLKESNLNKTEREEVTNSNFCKDINANKEQDSSSLSFKDRQIRRDSAEHPKQIQQWLQQILVETETEPMIHEIEQFSEISKARLSGQFPLET